MSIAPGQTTAPAPLTRPATPESLALARARTDLQNQIAHLPLTPDLTVGDWAVRAVARQRALRLWVRTRPRTGAVRLYSDGACEVDIRVGPNELAKHLIEFAGQHPPHTGSPLAAATIEEASGEWPVLWTTGAATPLEKTRAGKPAGWEDVSDVGIELARQAAAAEAVYALLEQAGDLRVTAAHRLGAFLESDQEVFSATHDAVQAAATMVIENAPDQIAVASAEIGLTELIRILTDVHQNHYHGAVFHAPDFREMALNVNQPRLRATGLAVPPDRCRLPRASQLTGPHVPAWARTTLTGIGQYEAPDGQEPSVEYRLKRARAAATGELRSKLGALVVNEALTVQHVLDRRPELQDDVTVFLGGARVVEERRALSDGPVSIRVELPLARLWLIVRPGLERVDADSSEGDGMSPPPSQESAP